MRELRTCDFCGTDAAGVFEVLPPELTPADDQRRVILCEHCQETLTDVISPLLARLGVDADVDVPDDAPAETGASTTPTSAGSGSVNDATSVDVEPVDPAPTPAESTDDTSSDPLDDSVHTGKTESKVEERGRIGEGKQAEDGGEETESETTTEPEPQADSAETDAEGKETGDDDMRPEPPKFRKVIRILQNREFPVERAEIEELASGAYDLDDDEVADIFDYAVERGVLVDDGGMLRRP
ncbi:hypothetical protein E6P09_02830 [Haloferax mediterranei ATCC 33500]|uniref:Uncharacterized protein n=1 Tax=Haloferax mediterranei (strain ATCC 33500 / DSM 1411 / JCM 8866 / NBRC 14739 / NCIMB 2177 / R-4) TaxID=523841 RepID=I3R8T3_HALMT|nr:hypothetical protein [Haloferax mediterranei]AFK20643.1 hypothetical protein HFX_2979 [Haloferax mediterranei ATCC 33500]AHZ22872.1 hypothetical protein BM92_09575 [Haloferax mediterranei ATCC 33500]EMA03037.1 hypothetical protein C439_10650 [Haloferax mediterranei ATCC 33500]MDX5987782.1 hypothetical protein [Haloferax mediterranei ATCC 33500]QCQ74260.1 hypothetical protein E6P09_02830 [Haloferax mediterranei ATCC 33500]